MQKLNRRKALITIATGATAIVLVGVGASFVPFEDWIATKLVVCDGDSLTRGYELAARNSYPAQLQHLLGYDYEVVNLGVDSQTLDGMIETAPTRVDNLINERWQKRILGAWAGTNDIYFGDSASKAFEDYVMYCKQRRQAGWKIIAMTALPRTNKNTSADFEIQRGQFNGLVREQWGTFADALADVGANSKIGSAGSEAGPYYRGDFVHLNRDGYGIVAAGVKTAILALP